MISKQNIYPPENWQDFESLCLKLWGEIWSVQGEIEFNSDNSSGQDGVDIYCIPQNKKGYYGIQCKNKKLFLKSGVLNKLAKSTIDEEINKAKNFKPPLKGLIIATSIGKDKELEEYVREINLKHLENNLFSVQICFWNFISRKIFEYKNVYNWYLKNENFNKTKSILVTFENNEKEIIHKPKFIKTKVTYRLQTKTEKEEELSHYRKAIEVIFDEKKESFVDRLLSFFRQQPLSLDSLAKISINGKDINSPEYIESTYPKPKNDNNSRVTFTAMNLVPGNQALSFKINIFNNGDSVIDDYKIYFTLLGNYEKVTVKTPRLSELNKYIATTWINENYGLIEPDENFIVQQDSFLSKEIILIPNKDKEETLVLKWKILSRDFNDTGELKINVVPEYIENEKIMFVLKEKDCKEDFEYSNIYTEGIYTLNY